MSAAATEWVLVQEAPDSPSGRQWFRSWTSGIGPCGTWDESEAARFPSEQAACASPAYSFALTFYRPEPVEAVAHERI